MSYSLVLVVVYLLAKGILYAYILLQALALLLIRKKPAEYPEPQEWPKISVWVAARNEEDNILRCLRSLHALDYPKENIEILVGNDQSEDRTAEIVTAFIADKPEFRLLQIEGALGKAKKKANVLAQLAHGSSGDFYLVCDADIEVKPTWAKEIARAFRPGTGVVSATTLITGKTWFARMQKHDWLFFMGLIKSAANAGIPCTAVGNNMAISKEAYWATGGYENIDFSITEDFKLFREIITRDYGWAHLFSEASTSFSAPAPDWRTLMKQRKRWLEGGRELPIYWKALLGIFGAFPLAIVVYGCFDWLPGLLIVFLYLVLQSLFLSALLQRLNEKRRLVDFLFYPLYSAVVSVSTALFFLLPSGREWKGRKFD